MSWDLQERLAEAKANPGMPVALVTKGVSFGTIVADQNSDVDFTNVEGVSNDLIVRPFQWRGIASNLRNFIRDAMNFHFSVQPRELLREHPDMNDMDGTSEGETNEILEGDITAVATFLAFLRPPTESSDGLNAQQVEQGRNVFAEAECTSCHVPSLTIDNPFATIRDPRTDETMLDVVRSEFPYAAARKKLKSKDMLKEGYFITVPYSVSPTMEKYVVKKHMKSVRALKEDITPEEIANQIVAKLRGYTRNLNRRDGPPETLPRLPHEANGSVPVPLYSDLKRHTMGENLAEPFNQKTDGGQEIAGNRFVTRPLWGVADTGPWMHDGRALTLTDAILMHDGENSEAKESVGKFRNLSGDDKLALRAFLSSLRLPTVH